AAAAPRRERVRDRLAGIAERGRVVRLVGELLDRRPLAALGVRLLERARDRAVQLGPALEREVVVERLAHDRVDELEAMAPARRRADEARPRREPGARGHHLGREAARRLQDADVELRADGRGDREERQRLGSERREALAGELAYLVGQLPRQVHRRALPGAE